MDLRDIYPEPKRDDEKNAKRWRGALFWQIASPLSWFDSLKGYYCFIERPRSVTFPICELCGHVIWDWPHFEEEVPDHACCDACAEEEEGNQWIERGD